MPTASSSECSSRRSNWRRWATTMNRGCPNGCAPTTNGCSDTARHSPHLTPLIAADPSVLGGRAGAEHLRRSADAGAKGIKVHPVLQKFLPGDSRMDEIYAVCEERRAHRSVPLGQFTDIATMGRSLCLLRRDGGPSPPAPASGASRRRELASGPGLRSRLPQRVVRPLRDHRLDGSSREPRPQTNWAA